MEDYIVVEDIKTETDRYYNLLEDGTYELDIDGSVKVYETDYEVITIQDVYGTKEYRLDEFNEQYDLLSYIVLDQNYGRGYTYWTKWAELSQ